MSRLILLLLLLPQLALASAPRAWLDRDTIRLGETVTLNIEVEGMTGAEPDFSVLDAGFQRLGVNSRTQMSLVNGQRSASTLWAVALEPREAGSFTVPAVPVGSETTQPLRLTVLPAATASAGEDVFLEVEATPLDPYVQQQVRYRIRLYYAVTLLDGQLEEPSVSGAELRRLGNDLSYQTQIGDRRYNVVERRFALIPESSGELVVPGVRFRGRAMGAAGRFGPGLSSGRQVTARSEPIALQVRPSPAGFATTWLPAAQLELTEPGNAWPDEITVGEPLSLELRIAARGLDGARLPQLELPGVDGLDAYPDQPVLRSGEDGEWLQGERRQRFALVAQRPGEFVLPELRLAWWNTESDRPEIATLPARRIRVLPAVSAGLVSGEPQILASEESASGGGALWLWQAISAALLLAWLSTLGLWWRQRRTPSSEQASAASGFVPSARALRAAMARRSPAEFDSALVALARQAGLPVTETGALVALLADAEQVASLKAYLAARWREGSVDWSGLTRVFSRGPVFASTSDGEARRDGVLPPHYPSRA